MDLNDVIQQANISKEAIQQIKNQNRIFETILHEAVKGAPNEDKSKIEEVRMMSKKVIDLAKQGKSEEAQQMIKDFQNGGKNN